MHVGYGNDIGNHVVPLQNRVQQDAVDKSPECYANTTPDKLGRIRISLSKAVE